MTKELTPWQHHQAQEAQHSGSESEQSLWIGRSILFSLCPYSLSAPVFLGAFTSGAKVTSAEAPATEASETKPQTEEGRVYDETPCQTAGDSSAVDGAQVVWKQSVGKTS